MSRVIWVSASPSLKYFHRRLLNSLSKVIKIEFWEYYQTLDEGSSIDGAIELLQEYLAPLSEPVHLIGHGIGGIVALGYVRKYSPKVTSLTLLSVAAQPAINWHSYYYTQLQSFPGDRHYLLRSIAIDLFPSICSTHVQDLADRLERDLVEAPANDSLFRLDTLPEGGIDLPLMICASQNDPVITLPVLCGWGSYLKDSDRIWHIPTGGHFFHHFHSELVSCQIQQFWQQSEPTIALHQLARMEFN